MLGFFPLTKTNKKPKHILTVAKAIPISAYFFLSEIHILLQISEPIDVKIEKHHFFNLQEGA